MSDSAGIASVSTVRDSSRGKGHAGLFLALLLLAAVGWFGVRAAMRGGEVRALTVEERYLADDRIDPLIYDCNFTKTFADSTADMIPVLVSKLNQGARDPLRQAKIELVEAGAEAIPALRRLFDEAYQDRWRNGVIQNVIAVVTLMEEPSGLEILRHALGHPHEAVRLAAAKGLAVQGDASDYDAVMGWLPLATNVPARVVYANAMRALDPERFYTEFAGWLRKGEHADLWSFLMLTLGEVTDPETARDLASLVDLRDDKLVPFLIAPMARLGDQAALDELHKRLGSEQLGQRQLAVQALGSIGRGLDTHLALADPNPGVRTLVVELLAEIEPTEEVDAWLREGLSDSVDKVREVCLVALVARGDEYATAQALGLLESHVVDRGLGIRALRGGWDQNEGSAEEAYRRLTRLYEESATDNSRDRVSMLQTISQVPLLEAAEFLMNFGSELHGTVKGLDAFRWSCGQAWNTGAPGQDLLRARLATETDPFRRLSLMEYIWQDHSDASRDVLMGVLQDESRDDFERLYAADRLTRLGPAARVAPAIKRVYLANTDRVVRPALQCLLWTWYGQHYDN